MTRLSFHVGLLMIVGGVLCVYVYWQIPSLLRSPNLLLDELTPFNNGQEVVNNERGVIHNEQEVVNNERGVINNEQEVANNERGVISDEQEVVFALVICEGGMAVNTGAMTSLERQLKQTKVLLKSAVALTSSHLRFIAVTDSRALFDQVLALTDDWPKEYQSKITLEYLPVWYPANHTDMKNNFRLCSTQRILLPSMLPYEDALIYLDTDILFMTAPEDLWALFEEFNSKQVVGIPPILASVPGLKVPYFNLTGRGGLNPGVMLMNNTRLKTFPGDGWEKENVKIYDEFKHQLVYGDQDIINLLFIKFPDVLFELNCEWDYQVDYCRFGTSFCPEAIKSGARVVHGNARTFVSDNLWKMRTLFESWHDFKLGTPLMDLFQTIRTNLRDVTLKHKIIFCDYFDEIDVVLSQRLLHHTQKQQHL